MRIKILTAVYIFILAGIIVLADLKGTQYLLNFVRFVPYGDKVGHFLLMGTFSFLLNLTLNAKTFRLWRINFLLGTLIVLVVVTLEEFSQIFIRGRSFDLIDLAVDYAGIFLFGELARLICRKFLRKESAANYTDNTNDRQ
ncbi:MAG TPA: VanZ family protein [Pyrinomonadaceae bacterium]